MTYLVDGRSLQDRSAVRGIGTYVRGLLSGYARLGVASEIELLVRRSGDVPTEVETLGLRRPRGRVPTLKRRLQPVADPFFMTALMRRLNPAVYHGVDYAQPWRSDVPVVITVHDLIPFIFPERYTWLRRERLLARHLLRDADAVIADSQATARDIARLTDVDESRVRVVPLAVGPEFRPAAAADVAEVRARYGLNRRFVLAVGTFDPRKRIDLLSDAVAKLCKDVDVDLVIAGSQGSFAGAVSKAIATAGIDATTHVVGFIPTPDLVALYAAADALLFTSEYEGFGLPPLEAMACGANVVMFDNSSLAEVAGDAAVVVANGDSDAFAAATAALIENAAERNRRRLSGVTWAAQFTWERTAAATLAVYREVERAGRGGSLGASDSGSGSS